MELDLPELDEEKIKKIKKETIESMYSNDSFLNFVEFHKISKIDVYNNLYDFMKVFECQENCKKCEGISSCPSKGFIYEMIKDDEKYITKHIQCNKLKKINRIKQNFIEFYDNKDVFDYDLSDALRVNRDLLVKDRTPLMASIMRNIKSSDYSSNYYLFGDKGTGKSFIMELYAKKIIEKTNKIISFISAKQMFPYLSNIKTYKPTDYVEEMNNLNTVDFLFIDELGQEIEEGYVLSDVLNEILTYRLNNQLPTILISRYSFNELSIKYQKTKNSFINFKDIKGYIDSKFKVFNLKCPYKI